MNAYLFSWVNGVIVTEPDLTSPQWKDWAAASLPPPPPPPSPSLRSLILQLNHALKSTEVAGHAEILSVFWKAERHTSILMCINKPRGSVRVPHSPQLSRSRGAVGAGLPLLLLCWVLCPHGPGPSAEGCPHSSASWSPHGWQHVIFWALKPCGSSWHPPITNIHYPLPLQDVVLSWPLVFWTIWLTRLDSTGDRVSHLMSSGF